MDAALLDAAPAAPAADASLDWFALSPMQTAYLVGRGALLPLGGVSSHVYHEFDLRGIDGAQLDQALHRVVARHEALRTVVRPDATQAVLPMARLPRTLVERHDARRLAPGQAERLLQDLRAQMVAQVAPLDRPCAVDARLVELPGGRSRLLVSHEGLHIDGLSMQILFADWARAYADPRAELPPLRGCYRLQVEAEQRQRAGIAWRRAREHWVARLQQGLAPAPRLPLAAEPAELPRGLSTRHEVRVDAATWAGLLAHAEAFGVTPAAALFTAYCEVLRRWSGPGAMTLNVTFANRLPVADGAEQAIGNYTSPVLVGEAGSGPCFADRAQAAQRGLREALEHRSFSALDTTRLLAAGDAQALATGVPYTFNCALGEAGELQGVETFGPQVFGASQTPQVWMNLFALRSRGGLWLQLDAVDGLFAPGVPDAVVELLGELVQRLGRSRSAWSAASFDLLPAEQRRRRAAANATEAPIPPGLVHEAFVAQARRRPDAVALCTSEGTLSYGELLAQAQALAAALAAQQVRPDEPVAVLLRKGPSQIAALLAVSMAGAAYLPIDPAWPLARATALMVSARPRVLLCDSAQPDIPSIGHCRIHVDRLPAAGAGAVGPVATRPEHLAYVLYTSGSTGQPKGVMVSHRSVVNLVADINRRYHVGPHDRAFGISHFNFDLSVYDIFGLLAAGGAIVLPDHDKVADPGHWLVLARRHGVTLWNSVPAIVQTLADHCEAAGEALPDSLRLILMSGDRIAPALPAQLHRQGTRAELHSLGGPTETTVWNICHPIGRLPPGATHVPYGKPNANNRYHVLDATLNDCPDWVVGELYAGGAGLARGYWQDEARTRDSFVTHPRSGERLYRTGDIGCYLPDGNIEIHGRSDFQVKINGHRVELGEIEACLAGHPEVHGCAAVGPGPRRPEAGLVAFVVMKDGREYLDEIHAEALKQHVARQLPRYMVPARIVCLAALPLSDNAKVDRRQLAALASAMAPSARPAAAPAAPNPTDSPLERRLLRLWAELLQLESIGPQQNFFQLGGDSMKAARLVVRLRKDFGVGASLAQVMQHQTVRELAAFVARCQAGSGP